MTQDDFSAFYEAVHGYPPFPWQKRLLAEVVSRGWPKTIALPTSSGKTSAIDVAVFHLALEAKKSALERKAALRIFFVIDRRVVVDEAAEHATKLARALQGSVTSPVASVANALREFGAELPLDVAVLRGGMYRDNTWADEPNQPLICLSTVDQVGSRLLFRGYQVSDEAKPVHAGLVGNDSLLIVDEAHLSVAFLDTLAAVRRHANGREFVARGIEVVEMSATLEEAGEPFQLEEADESTPELGNRLQASKVAELREPEKGFGDEIVRAAKDLPVLPEVAIIGVVVNTVAVARAVFEELRKVKDAEAILLTGRNRPYAARNLWETYRERIAAKKGRMSKGRLFVVATQTVEVGANLDFDALVSESAPLDALRQRFGRLNRLGQRQESNAVLVRRPKEDPVYGAPTAETWAFLKSLGKVDFGVTAMNSALQGQDQQGFNTKGERGPLVFPQFFQLWAQTNPLPEPDPDIAPFLHGRDALEDADVQVVWREDVKEEGSGREWQDAVESVPPLSSESLPLPIGSLRRWLRGDAAVTLSDLEGSPSDKEDIRKTAKPLLIWRGKSEDEVRTDLRQVRPGDVVILPATYGGCDEFGWNPSSTGPVDDIGDLANNELAEKGLRRFRVRLDLIRAKLEGDKRAEFDLILAKCREFEEQDVDYRKELAALLSNVEGLPQEPPKIDSGLRVATWPKMISRAKQVSPSLKPEDLDDDSVGQTKEITLRAHTAGVMKHAATFAAKCGLGQHLADDIVLAAKLHDLGKWDDRFQAMLCGGSEERALRLPEPLAKSGGSFTMQERRAARQRAHYPPHARHESASVLMACVSGELAKAHDKDLVLHLIGTHHGYGRPLLPVWDDGEDVTVIAKLDQQTMETGSGRELGMLSSGWIDRFTELNHRYGIWGLAYLESILRRSDCTQSRKEQMV